MINLSSPYMCRMICLIFATALGWVICSTSKKSLTSAMALSIDA